MPSVSACSSPGDPKRLWIVSDERVFEAMLGDSGAYHGYPVRRSDPTHDAVLERLRTS
jgi:hypothetical protein